MTIIADMSLTAFLVVALVTMVFVATIVVNIVGVRRFREKSRQTRSVSSIMQHALDMEDIKVVRVKMAHRLIFNVHGNLLPENGITTAEYLEDVHPDDRQQLRQFVTQISLGKTNTGECHYRRKRQDENGNWQWHHIHNNAVKEGRSTPYDVFCILNDETADMEEQQHEMDLGRRYRSIFERSIVGLAIYDERGMLLAANEDMRQTMHMEGENDPYFYGISLFSRPPFRDLMQAGEPTELHICTKLVVPERNMHSYLEMQLRPELNDEGQVLHYSLSTRDVTEERSLYLKDRENDERIRQANEEIQRYETELQYLMDRCDMRVWRVTFSNQEVTLYKSLNTYERKLSLSDLMKLFVDDDGAVAQKFAHPEQAFSKPFTLIRRMRSIFHDPNEILWNILDGIPVFDKNGQLEGCFGIIRNITPLIQAQEMLKEETRRANDSARLKSVFMANMTHEIRTPLNSIVGFSDLLPMIESPEEKKEMTRVIMNNCDMLLRLINDILEISTMDGNAIIITPEEVDFARVFDDLFESLKQRVQNPNVEFQKDNPYDTLTLNVDQKRIQQVITNFVTNSIKYTNEGHIRVGYRIEERERREERNLASEERGERREERELYIYCEDTGAGIPKEKQPTVFDRFVKLNDYVQGTGLGLSICKAIAIRYGGAIGIESEGEGQGSTFWLRIPINNITEAS